jgi:hypothetical protein
VARLLIIALDRQQTIIPHTECSFCYLNSYLLKAILDRSGKESIVINEQPNNYRPPLLTAFFVLGAFLKMERTRLFAQEILIFRK